MKRPTYHREQRAGDGVTITISTSVKPREVWRALCASERGIGRMARSVSSKRQRAAARVGLITLMHRLYHHGGRQRVQGGCRAAAGMTGPSRRCSY
jgi:hypothetical protein